MSRATLFVFAVVLAAVAALLAFAPAPGTVSAADEEPAYVGADSCKKCHFAQHKSWKDGKLAKAFEDLKPGNAVEAKKAAGLDPDKDYCQDPACLACHTTGYGTPTGYPAPPAEGAEWTEEEKTRAALNEGVTCEACHGPGSLYGPYKKDHKEFKHAEIRALGALVPVTAEHCTDCHDKSKSPTVKDFDFEKARKSEEMHKHKELKVDHSDPK
jgi:hypothetical protein